MNYVENCTFLTGMPSKLVNECLIAKYGLYTNESRYLLLVTLLDDQFTVYFVRDCSCTVTAMYQLPKLESARSRLICTDHITNDCVSVVCMFGVLLYTMRTCVSLVMILLTWTLTDDFGLHNTHTRLTALFPGLPGWSGTRKVKPIWILLKQETVSGSGISWAMCKSAPRSRQITMPEPHHSVFLQAGCPSCCPTNSVKALKGGVSLAFTVHLR